MTKYWTHGFAALTLALSLVITTSVFAEDDITAGMFAENDIFVDEGDGDFDTGSVALDTDSKTEPAAPVAAAPAPAPAPDTSAVEEELATPTIVEEKPEAAPAVGQPSNEDLFADEDPSATKAPVAVEEKPVKKDKPAKKVVEKKAVEKKVAAKKAKAPKATKVAKSTSKGKGHFAWTTGTCKLKRAPASTKGSLGETSASRKIWVVDVDSKWVKVWNKDGKEAFLARSCLK